MIVLLYLFMGLLLTWTLDKLGNINLRWGAHWGEWVLGVITALFWPAAFPYNLVFSVNTKDETSRRKHTLAAIEWGVFVLLFALVVLS